MSLHILPNEILLIIFNYCDTYDLIRLNSVCKRFYNITSIVLNKISDHLLVTGQMSEKFRERCQPLLSSYTSKFVMNYMWKYGKYERKIIYPKSKLILNQYLHAAYPKRYWSNILMTKDIIVFRLCHLGHNQYLCAINRTKNGSLSDNWVAEESHPGIYVNVLCNDVVVSGHQDNSIREWTIKSLDGQKYFKQKLLCSANNIRDRMHTIDVTPRNIITSSIKGIIKIWNYTPQEDTISIIKENITLKHNRFHDEQYLVSSLAFDFTGTKFAAGCSKTRTHTSSCIIYDINNCSEKYEIINIDLAPNMSFTSQILWEDPNTILCRGKNQIIKMDVRTHKVVCRWSSFNHYQEWIYLYYTCMSSDNLYAFMTGVSNGQVVLWDQRQSTSIQRYNICNSNIESLQFDSSHMFTVGEELYEWDFTKYSSHTKTKSVLSY